METRMTSCNTTKNNQVKIRIKTLHENPLEKQRLSEPNHDNTQIAPIRLSDNELGFKKSQKTYYNMYVSGNHNQFEEKPQFKPVQDNTLRKNNYSLYTQ